jgi:hypothetical protein
MEDSNSSSGNNEQRPRRRIIPQARVGNGIVQVERVHSVTAMLDRALTIIDDQLIRLSLKARAATLDDKESRILQGYVKSLVELSKEEREREKANKEAGDLGELTPEQLLELGRETLLGLKSDKNK